MSQISSQIHDPGWVSIPFAKFSHNTSPYGTRNFVWNHVGTRNDLDFIVREVKLVDDKGNYTNRVLMRLTAGAEILDVQDLGELVQIARDFDPSSGVENPVQIVIRSPFLAMRYPKNDNEVRRIQIKFHNQFDFTKALNVLKDLGLPITDTSQGISTSIQSSPSPAISIFSSRSAASTSTLATSVRRPSSTQDNSRSFGAHSNLTPRIEFKTPALPDVFNSEPRRPSSAQSFHTFNVLSRARSSLDGPFLERLELSALQDSARRSPSFFEAQIDREPPAYQLKYPGDQTYLPHEDQNSSTPDLPHSLPAQHLLVEQHKNMGREVTTSPLFQTQKHPTRLAQPPHHSPGDTATQYLPGTQEASGNSQSGIEKHTTYALVPPRREIPFSKPREISKLRCASASGLPALPKPTPLKRAISTIIRPKTVTSTTPIPPPKIITKRIAQRKPPAKEAEPVKPDIDRAPVEVGEESPAKLNTVADEPSPLAAKSAAAVRPGSATGLQSKTAATKKRAAVSCPSRPSSVAKRPKMVDHGTQTQTLSGRDHSTAMQSLTSTEISQTTPADFTGPSDIPKTYLSALDAYVTKYKSRPTPKEQWEVAGYAEADAEARQVLLNDFICHNLENVDFLQLCEDTELAWRRIALGT